MKPTKEFLIQKNHIEENNIADIARICNLNSSTISYYFKKFNIKPKKHKKISHNSAFLVGEKFGLLTVISRHHTGPTNRQVYWLCICECGNEKIANTTLLKKGNIKSCGCLNHKKGDTNSRFKGYGEVSGSYFYHIKERASYRGREFDLDIKYLWELFLQQDRKCAISGIKIFLVTDYRTNKSEQTASLDRIDSSVGYIKGNVQWVHKVINKMKLDLKQEEFIDWCKLISNKYLEKN